MGREDDTEYYQRRAEEEVQKAQGATEPSVVAAHYELAELYLSRLPGRNAPTAPASQVETDVSG